MAATRNPYYARAYSHGTDGSAALAGDPIAHQRKVTRRRVEQEPTPPRERGLPIPRWIVVVAAALCLLLMYNAYGRMNDEKKEIENNIRLQALYLEQSQTKIEETKAQIEIASDETRIRSIAANRLGMTMPTADQIVYVPSGSTAQSEAQEQWEKPSSGGQSLFQLILSSVRR